MILLRVGYAIELIELDLRYRRDAGSTLAHDLLDLRLDASRHRRKAPGHVLDLRTQLTLGLDDPLSIRRVRFVRFASLFEHGTPPARLTPPRDNYSR